MSFSVPCRPLRLRDSPQPLPGLLADRKGCFRGPLNGFLMADAIRLGVFVRGFRHP